MSSSIPAASLSGTGSQLRRVQQQQHRAVDAALARVGSSLAQWDALGQLAAHPGASLHDLAVLTGQTDQSCGALAGRMRAGGLIERMPGRGRAVRHRLTAKGEQVREAGAALVEDVLRAAFQPLTPSQLNTLDRLLRLLVRDAPS